METSTYVEVHSEEGIIVDVPMPSKTMSQIKAHEMVTGGKKVKVPEHWRYGKQYPGTNGGKGIFLNTHFYEVDFHDFGGKIVATVKVMEKTMPDGRVFHMVDVFKTGNVQAINSNLRAKRMAIVAEAVKTNGDLRIAGTNHFVAFKPL